MSLPVSFLLHSRPSDRICLLEDFWYFSADHNLFATGFSDAAFNLLDTVDGSEILHHLTWTIPCKYWDKLPTSTGERRISEPSIVPIAACRPWKTCCQVVRCQWCLLLHLDCTFAPFFMRFSLLQATPYPWFKNGICDEFRQLSQHPGILAAQICPTACFILWNIFWNSHCFCCKCASIIPSWTRFVVWCHFSQFISIHIGSQNLFCLRWKLTLDIWKVLLVWLA